MLVYRIEHKHVKCGFFTAINVMKRPEYKSFHTSGIFKIHNEMQGFPYNPYDEACELNIRHEYIKFVDNDDTRWGTKSLKDILKIWTNKPKLLQLLHNNDFQLVIYNVHKNYTLTLITQVVFLCNKAIVRETIPLTNFIQ